jgi:hypothetical protein
VGLLDKVIEDLLPSEVFALGLTNIQYGYSVLSFLRRQGKKEGRLQPSFLVDWIVELYGLSRKTRLQKEDKLTKGGFFCRYVVFM